MLWKNRNKSVSVCLTVVVSCLVLAVAWAVLATPETALAKGKPGGGGGQPQDIRICVVVDNQTVAPYAGVSSDDALSGTNVYCDNKKDHILGVVGAYPGRFKLKTNTNDNPTGRTMALAFTNRILDLNPPGAPEHLFDILGTVMPVGVELFSARSSVNPGYVDLQGMVIGSSALLPLQIRLIVTNEQNSYWLDYGDTLWNPEDTDHWDDNMYLADLVTVTREPDIGGKKVWTIHNNGADYAYLRRTVQWSNWIPVGIYSMPLSLTITEI